MIDPNTNAPYPNPGINMAANIQTGVNNLTAGLVTGSSTVTLLAFAGEVVTGGSMDHQRPNGLVAFVPWMPQTDAFVSANTNVTAYNFGVVAAASGIPLVTALNSAGWYNSNF